MVVLNPSSGRQIHDAAQVLSAFQKAGVTPQLVPLGPDLKMHMRGVTRLPSGTVVVAAGGDGTIRAVASHLVNTNITMAILPLGTRNHFARDLGISNLLEDAIRTALHGQVQSVDVGDVNGHIFVNNASLGLYPRIADDRERHRFRFGSRAGWSFIRSALKALRDLAFSKLLVDVKILEPAQVTTSSSDDAGVMPRRTPLVFVGNNAYELEGLGLGQRKCLNQGTLMLVRAHPKGRWGLIRMAIRSLFKRLHTERDLKVTAATRFDLFIRNRRYIRVALDGDVVRLTSPLRFRSLPSTLRVVVPTTTNAIGAQPQQCR